MAQELPSTAAVGSPVSGTTPSSSGVIPASKNQANGGSHPAQPHEDCSVPVQRIPAASSSAQPAADVDKQLPVDRPEQDRQSSVDRPEQVAQVEGGSSQAEQGTEAPSASRTTSLGQGAHPAEVHQQNGSAVSRALGSKRQPGKMDMPPKKASSIRMLLPDSSCLEKEPISNGNSVQSGIPPDSPSLTTAEILAGSSGAVRSA